MNIVYFADGRWAVEPYTGRKKPIGRFTCGPARSKQEVRALVRRSIESGAPVSLLKAIRPGDSMILRENPNHISVYIGVCESPVRPLRGFVVESESPSLIGHILQYSVDDVVFGPARPIPKLREAPIPLAVQMQGKLPK